MGGRTAKRSSRERVRIPSLFLYHYILVIIIKLRPVSRPVVIFGAVLRSAFQPVFADVGTIAAQIRIVSEHLPRHRLMIAADTQKAADAQHGVDNFADFRRPGTRLQLTCSFRRAQTNG